MKVNQVELSNGRMVWVIEEIFGIRYSGDRFVLGLILGHCELTETDLEIVECELEDPASELFEVMVGEPRTIEMTDKEFDRMVEIVKAWRSGELS